MVPGMRNFRRNKAAAVSGVAAVVILSGVTLSGCNTPASKQSDTPSKEQSLWSARTPYVGNNSRVDALMTAVGFGSQGPYTIALQTRKSPYGATVAFQRLDKPFDDIDFSGNATLLLGLVANLDHVSVTSGTHTYTLSEADASKELGYDVKDLGRDQNKLKVYLDSSQD